MIRPGNCLAHVPSRRRLLSRQAFTLVELLVATTLTLIMMALVAAIFGLLGGSINDARATLEMADRLRATGARLQRDLEGVTVTTLPPRRPGAGEGYTQITEGPIGPFVPPENVAFNIDTGLAGDTTVGDIDDMLMFTTRSRSQPFVGKFGAGTIESPVAEIAWFVRGRTLYRRVLLVLPNAPVVGPAAGFFNNCDLSVRNQGGALVANTLGDLAKPENRFAHQPGAFPFHPHLSGNWSQLGLPTLRECSDPTWVATGTLPPIVLTPRPAPLNVFDAWSNPHPCQEVDLSTGTLLTYMGPRVAEDVILNNVIGFDVKVWDPGAPVLSTGAVALMPDDPGYAAALSAGAPVVSYGAYVDLGYQNLPYNPAYVPAPGMPAMQFNHVGVPGSGLTRVYDTWSLHYEHDGFDQDDGGAGPFDEGTDGLDSDSNGIVDDPGERETFPPYPVPLRGIQVKIRVFDPDSRQIRELTVVQDFLPK